MKEENRDKTLDRSNSVQSKAKNKLVRFSMEKFNISIYNNARCLPLLSEDSKIGLFNLLSGLTALSYNFLQMFQLFSLSLPSFIDNSINNFGILFFRFEKLELDRKRRRRNGFHLFFIICRAYLVSISGTAAFIFQIKRLVYFEWHDGTSGRGAI